MDKTAIQDARQRLKSAQRLLLTSHIRPDGDAVGSLLGMGLALENAGKQVEMVLADTVPQAFRHLHGSERVHKKVEGSVDAVIVLDSGDPQRVGEILPQGAIIDINIDHHITNTQFGRINLVDTRAAATAEILTALLPQLGLTITPPVAAALLTGLLTDTIGFRTSNMRPRTLRIAAELMEYGADLPTLYEKALNSRSFEAVRLWGAGLSSLQRQDRLVWATLSLNDRRAIGYPGLDDADLINILTTIRDADVAVTFTEQPDDQVKVSWRARPQYNVAEIARQFGGGGHRPAAGATIPGDLPTVQASVLQATRALFNGTQTNHRVHHNPKSENKVK